MSFQPEPEIWSHNTGQRTPVADLGKGPGGQVPPLFWVKNEEMTEGKKASRARKSKLGPLLCSRSGSATGYLVLTAVNLP